MEINIIFVVLAAFLGGIAAALVGWGDQKTSFVWSKFRTSLIRSFIGAIAIAAAMNFAGPVTSMLYLYAFLSGAGVETGGNRIAGVFKKKTTE